MAKPDCDDGWLRYAHELDAALAVANFTKGARIVLREIFAQLFGPAKLKTGRVSPTELARCTGQVKTAIVRSVRELVESDVLRKHPDGSYAFNKDYETWQQWGRTGGSAAPRLSRDEVIYCRNAPVRAMAYKAGYLGQIQSDEGNRLVTDGNQAVTPEIIDKVTIGLPSGNHRVTETVTIGLPDESPPLVSPFVNGREEETKETIETSPPPHGCGDRSATEAESRSPNVRTPEDLALVREAMQILASHPNSGHLAERVGREHNTPDNVRLAGWKWVVAASKAFERSEGDGKPIDWPYLRGIVRNARRAEYDKIRAESAPDPDPATPAANRPLARKPTPAERRKADSEAIRLAVSQLDPDEEP